MTTTQDCLRGRITGRVDFTNVAKRTIIKPSDYSDKQRQTTRTIRDVRQDLSMRTPSDENRATEREQSDTRDNDSKATIALIHPRLPRYQTSGGQTLNHPSSVESILLSLHCEANVHRGHCLKIKTSRTIRVQIFAFLFIVFDPLLI